MIITIVRTLIMYILVVGALRMMGKRQIGELEASELVVTIIISDIAAMPITNIEVPLITNISAIFDAYDFRGNPVVFGVQEYGRENCALRAAEYVL